MACLRKAAEIRYVHYTGTKSNFSKTLNTQRISIAIHLPYRTETEQLPGFLCKITFCSLHQLVPESATPPSHVLPVLSWSSNLTTGTKTGTAGDSVLTARSGTSTFCTLDGPSPAAAA
mmetsp:Transcript_5256/g.8242  ORF Transcript_5256/g.8242 Transcript_5256/m.8242 type:complete len:118 (+) Transcript_5256:58-411(+)